MAEKNEVRPELRVDAVGIKRAGAAAIMRRLEGMTFEQQVEYWRKASEDFERKYSQPDHKRASA